MSFPENGYGWNPSVGVKGRVTINLDILRPGFCGYFASVQFGYLVADGMPHVRSIVLGIQVKSLEWPAYQIDILFVEPHSVVVDAYLVPGGIPGSPLQETPKLIRGNYPGGMFDITLCILPRSLICRIPGIYLMKKCFRKCHIRPNG